MTVVSRESAAPGTLPPPLARPAGAAWVVVGLLFLATLLNYLDRQTISVTASRIAQDIPMTDADLGKIFFAFLLAYGVAQLAVGPLLDRWPVRYAYPIAVVAWSLAGAAAVLAFDFWSLFLLRMLLGVFESPNWPLALRVVSRTVPPSRRALANGLFQCGTSVGALIAPPIIIWLTNVHTWRFAFLIVGAVGLVWAALWHVWFRLRPDPRLDSAYPAEEREHPPVEEAASTSPGTLGDIFRSRMFWGLVLATTFLNPLQYFYTTWLPRYFDTYAGVSFGRELAARLVVVYFALDVGLIAGGVAVALLAAKLGVASARRWVATLGAACMAGIQLVAGQTDLDHITGLICLATFGLGCFMVNYLSFTSEVSARRVSTAAGLLGGTGSLAGAAFMWLVGDLVTSSGSFQFVFLLAGLMPIVALAGIWLGTIRQTQPSTFQRGTP